MIMKSPYFLNVDLDIESNTPLRSLAREWGDNVVILFSGRMKGRYYLHVECEGANRNQDATLNALCALVEGLSVDAKRVWDAARVKEFNLGYDTRFSSQDAKYNYLRIRSGTLRRIARLGASVAVTLYREEDPIKRAPRTPR